MKFLNVPTMMWCMDDGRRRAALAVAARRGDLEWTQQQLASNAHVDVKTIGNLESRDVWPNARTRARIEKALGWAPGKLEHLRTQTPGPEPEIPESLRRQVAALTPRQREWMIAWLREEIRRQDGEDLDHPQAAEA